MNFINQIPSDFSGNIFVAQGETVLYGRQAAVRMEQ